MSNKFCFFFLKVFAVFLGLLIYALKASLLIDISFKSKKNHENYLKMLLNKFQKQFTIILGLFLI